MTSQHKPIFTEICWYKYLLSYPNIDADHLVHLVNQLMPSSAVSFGVAILASIKGLSDVEASCLSLVDWAKQVTQEGARDGKAAKRPRHQSRNAAGYLNSWRRIIEASQVLDTLNPKN